MDRSSRLAASIEEQLRESQERYELAIRGSNDGIWDWDMRTETVYFSPRWKSMLGYEDHEIDSRFEEWQRRVHPDDLPRALATLQAHLEGESEFFELEHRLQHKDGTYRVILTRGASLRDPDGRAYRIAGSHTDITERKLAEEHLCEQEEAYRSIFEATGEALIIADLEGYIVEANPAACRIYGYERDELIGMHSNEITEQQYRAEIPEAARVTMEGGIYDTRAVSIRKDGTRFPVDARGAAFLYKGKPHVLGVMRDVTELVKAQAELERRVDERTRELSVVLDVSRNVASTLHLQPLLNLILDQLKVVAEYTGSAIWIVENENLVMIATRGPEPEDHLLQSRVSLPHGEVIADSILRGKPVIIDDVHADDPLAASYRQAAADLMQTTLSYVSSWMAVPLLLRNRVIGMLSLAAATPHFYTPDHIRIAMAIADQVAIAIDNARLYEKAQEVAVLEERQRLSRELHDSVSQALYSIALGARTARALLDQDPSRLKDPLEFVLAQAEAGLVEMRALIFELRPEAVEQEGLVAALQKQVAAWQARQRTPVEASWCEEPEVPLPVKEALYRIAQEALHNIAKHARATTVELRLEQSYEDLLLVVRDNGRGFDAGQSFPGHLGLHSMRERAARLAGSMQVESVPGSGSTIRVRVPLNGA